MNRMFVYGLLKPGLRLHHVAEPYVERAVVGRTRGRLYDAGVPAARFDEDGEVEGFVFYIDESRLDEALLVLDDLEDEGTEYRRITITVSTDEGDVEAHAYEYLMALAPEAYVGTTWS